MSSEYKHRFTVFTATYNRCEYLPALYEDLKNQTFKDFEWVVVNDGSSDDTDAVMSELINRRELDIVYASMTRNGGKHQAWRKGLETFGGRYVITADDDDPVLPTMLEIHSKAWEKLEQEPAYDDFWEVRTRCRKDTGELIGPELPSPFFDSDYIEVSIKLRKGCEMQGSRKVEALREVAGIPSFIYEDKCSNFSECIRWIRAAKKYKTRFIPAVTRIYKPNLDGLVNTGGSVRGAWNSFVQGGYMLLENRDLLLKYNLGKYFFNCALVGMMAARCGGKISAFRLHPVDNFLSQSAKILFKLYYTFRNIHFH